MQRNSEKAPKNFIFVEVSRCRYLDRRSIEPCVQIRISVDLHVWDFELEPDPQKLFKACVPLDVGQGVGSGSAI